MSIRGAGRNVETDLEAELVAWPAGGNVHAGFARRVRAMKGALHLAVARLAAVPRPLWFTGHSLGAGEALLAASLITTVAGVFTFGCPRPGDAAFWRGVHAPVFRFVHALDMVPRLPPPVEGYRHGGTRWHISASGKLRRSSWRPWPDWAPVPLEQGVLDHRIGEYARLLRGDGG